MEKIRNKKDYIYFFSQFSILACLLSCSPTSTSHFQLSSEDETAAVYILPGEPENVHLAVKDLISDVEKITGKVLKTSNSLKDCEEGCMVIGSMNRESASQVMLNYSEELKELEGKWESYRVETIDENLIIAGSDERGTMFGIYHFIEDYLNVDPLYFWKDREPEKRESLTWENVYIHQEEPSFKYRGLFVNDEDLLTEWMESGGKRNIDYPYYSQVVNPKVMENLTEAMVRLRYNLIIPASFIDIKNPPEKKLLDIAAQRGVFLSMHHIEPLGVSAFTFFNYWKERGKDYKFSYYSNPAELKEVWNEYSREWAQYDNVVWQIGLRGVADRPMWEADKDIPQSDEDRGKLISDAMADQVEIIKSVDKRKEISISTTLWMEGSNLNRDGHLTFPENIMVIFSDNSPGWEMQEDFFETERDPNQTYGVYYHHQLWGTGPHLAQGVPPTKAHEIMQLAVEYGSDEYAILNVSNIRTFVLGLQGSSEMLQNFESFDPELFLADWCKENFSGAPKKAETAYRQFFNSYQMHDKTNAPVLLDGQIRRKGLGLLGALKKQLEAPERFSKESGKANNGEDFAWADQYLKDPRTGNLTFAELEEKVRLQKENLEKTDKLIKETLEELEGWEKYFFEVNLVSQQQILYGLTLWLEAVVEAVKTFPIADKENHVNFITQAVESFEIIRNGQRYNTRGGKWENWYRGDTKLDVGNLKERTREILQLTKQAENK